MLDTDSDVFLETIDTNFKLFGKPKPDRDVKAAWWRLLKPFDLLDIKRAFGKHAVDCKFLPKPADIIAAIKDIHDQQRQQQREHEEQLEHERVAALPPPTHEVDAMQMLAEAQETAAKGGRTREQWDRVIASHEQLIAEHTRLGHITRRVNSMNPECAVNHCRKTGALTSSLKGTEKWYCAIHYHAN